MASILNVDQINNAAGTSGITLDASTGAASFPNGATLPAGSVLQVVNVSYGTQEVFSNTSFSASGLTLSITPSNATSKILVAGSVNLYQGTASTYTTVSVYRDASVNLGGTNWGFGEIYGNSGDRFGQVSFTYLDSPSTTSAVTYTVYKRVSANQGYINLNTGELSTMTLMEIAQ